MRVRLLLAAEHLSVRRRLRQLLEAHGDCDVIAEATDGREAVRLAEVHQPDVAVIDMATFVLNSAEATQRLIAKSPGTKVIVLSVHSDDAYVTHARKAGASGFVVTDAADVDLPRAVREVSQGRSFVSPARGQTAGNSTDDAGRRPPPMASELSAELLDFIHHCIPTLQAAEVLLFLASQVGPISPEEVVAAMRPRVVTVPAVTEYAQRLVEAGVVVAHPSGYAYVTASQAFEQAIGELRDAYNERPVTLIAAIYKIADRKIQSLDSFDLRRTDT